MSDMNASLIDNSARGGSRYAELAPEQTTARPAWYDARSTRIALCVAVVLVVCVIVLVPLIMAKVRLSSQTSSATFISLYACSRPCADLCVCDVL